MESPAQIAALHSLLLMQPEGTQRRALAMGG